jgi:hypothetical protein
MNTRGYDQRKTPQSSAFAPVKNRFQSRPFAVQDEVEESSAQQQETPDLQKQLEKEERVGYNFAKVSVVASSTPPPDQRTHSLLQPRLDRDDGGFVDMNQPDNPLLQRMIADIQPSRPVSRGGRVEPIAETSPTKDAFTAHETTPVMQPTGGAQLQAKLQKQDVHPINPAIGHKDWVQRYPDTSFEIVRMGLANSVLELGINQVIEKKKTKNDLLNEAFWMTYPEMNGKKIESVSDPKEKQTYIDAYLHIAKTLYPKVYKQAKRTVEPKSDDTSQKSFLDDIWDWMLGSNPSSSKKAAEDTKKIKPEDLEDLTTFEEGNDDITTGILESIKEDLAEVGESPETWFENFVDITFLGKTMKHPIHRILAAHLKNVEAKFVSQTGAKDAKEAAKKLGLTEAYVSGGRTPQEEGASTSMHVFGLAVDVDVTHNPWIAIPNQKLDKTEGGGEEKWANTYYGYMQELLGGETLEFKRDFNLGKVGGLSLDDRLTATIENVLKIDKMVESYFSLLAPENDAKLQELLNKTTSSRWKGKTTEEARKLIQDDLKNCGQIWRRKSEKAQEEISKGGITNLSEEVIRGMDLYWGGMFGDLMHFDLRDRGIGNKVYQAALKQKQASNKKKKEK